MKFFKNKFFIILLSLAVFATVLTATLSFMGVTDPLKDLTNSVAVPFRSLGNTIKEAFDGYSRYFSTIDQLDSENKELEGEIESLIEQLADADAVKEENERLREYLEIKKTYPDFKFIEALVIGTESENLTSIYTLNKGKNDGVKLGMPIIVGKGLVGSVCEVGKDWCRVRTLAEASASAGAYISRSGELGVVDGDISLKDTGLCYLKYLDADADVEVGDLVYTGGNGSVYPRDLFIGKIIEVKTNTHLRTKEAVIELAADLDGLKYVLIVTDFDRFTED